MQTGIKHYGTGDVIRNYADKTTGLIWHRLWASHITTDKIHWGDNTYWYQLHHEYQASVCLQ